MTTQLTAAGAAIEQRRNTLGLTQTAAADLANVSRSTWIRAEHGTGPLSGPNAAGVMRALGWTPGSYQLLLADKPPIEGDMPPAADDRLDAMQARVDALGEQVDKMTDVLGDVQATLRTLLNLGD